jgi:hypothetical protein
MPVAKSIKLLLTIKPEDLAAFDELVEAESTDLGKSPNRSRTFRRIIRDEVKRAARRAKADAE